MVKAFIRLFVKSDNYVDLDTREKIGSLGGIMGIILNILMSAAKITVGALIGAISILSDGINNLSDAGSSVITLLGFKLSSRRPDKQHPYGFGRIEYFAGLLVGIIIIVLAVELFSDSVSKVANGEVISYDDMPTLIATIAVLSVSVLIKLWMAVFNKQAGKLIGSMAMEATSSDSISDCVSTTVVLVCTILSLFIKDVPIDGFAGIAVSLFIAYTGIRSVLEIVSVLLGQAPDEELVKAIGDFVLNYDEKVVGIHDFMFHDYGPGRKYLVLHAEVPAEENIMTLHDMIDNIETDLEEKFNCFATIHMDPVITTSDRVKELKKLCNDIVKGIDPEFTMHDFRMNEGDSHANLIFDVVITHKTKSTEDEIKEAICSKLKEHDPKLMAVIKIEYSFV